jgi:hypothetical protein
LSEYAYKLWQGLLGDYYYNRWDMWTTQVLETMAYKLQFNEPQWFSDLEFWEEVKTSIC